MKIKIAPNKQRNTIAKQSQLSSLNTSMIKLTKQDSKHTKMSSNFTAQSLHIASETKKKKKAKKQQQQNTEKKQKTIRQKETHSANKVKKLKQKLKNNKSCDFQRQKYFHQQEQESVSYREYCLVQNSFVPVTSFCQHQKLQDIMRSTADTTHIFQDFNRMTFRKVFPIKLKDHQHSVSSISEDMDSIFKGQSKVSKRQVQIQAIPFYEEVGIQYSQRQQIKQIINGSKPKIVEVNTQTDEIVKQKVLIKSQEFESPKLKKTDETLSDLLLKLQFKHLPNQMSFSNISKTQKDHYTQLLTSLISKLNQSPREPQKFQIKSKQKIQIEEINIHYVPLEEIKIKYEALQMEVYKRQSSQMNWIPHRNHFEENDNVIDTSFMAVTSFIFNFFCYIELNYIQEFIINISRNYGLSFIESYFKITRNTSIERLIESNNQHSVIGEYIFNEYCDQVISNTYTQVSQLCQVQKTHDRAIFDYANQLLDSYKPFFELKGEPFPWAVKSQNRICQYVIDEDSLALIFGQIKEIIQKSATFLCGLIVDQTFYKGIEQINPLGLKRSQRQNLLIESWLNEKTNENRAIECYSTRIFFELSESIYNELLLEMFKEKPFKS